MQVIVKYCFTLLFMVTSVTLLEAQPIELPNERIFLYADKPACKQGDTLQVHGQLLTSDKQFERYSNYIYVELFNGKDSVLVRQKTKCRDDGSFALPFQIDYDWPNSVYYLRAYTRLMQNFTPESFPVVELPVGIELFVPNTNVPGVKCSFFPEGGRWVNGDVQNITVYLMDSHGTSLQAPFHIINHTDTVISTSSLASGLQTIRLFPKEGDQFVLHIDYQGEKFAFTFPEREQGHTLQSVMNRHRISFKVISDGKRITKERLFIFRPSNGLEEIKLTDQLSAGILNLLPEETGLYALFLTDESANIIAQTVHWRNSKRLPVLPEKKEYLSDETIKLQTDYLADSIRLFHRIVKRGQLAKPAVLQVELESELFSPVSFPRQYTESENNSTVEDIEAWLRTTRFIRFNPADIVDKDFHYRYQPEIVNLFTGKVTHKSGKPLKGGSIVAYNSVTNQVDDGEIALNGRYTIPVTDFKDSDYFFLQAHPMKGTAGYYEYIPDADTFPSILNRYRSNYWDRKYAEANVTYQDSSGFSYQVDDFGNRDYIMPEITVKARTKQDRYVSTEKFYKVNYIDEEEIEKRNYTKIEDILQDMPGVSFIMDDQMDAFGSGAKVPRLVSLRGPSALSKSDIIVLLDGSRVELEQVVNLLPPEQIASVELLKPWQTNAVVSGALTGALLITTKSGHRSVDAVSKGFYYYPQGLTSGEAESDKVIRAPSAPGPYDLMIDIATKTGEVHSYRLPFDVR